MRTVSLALARAEELSATPAVTAEPMKYRRFIRASIALPENRRQSSGLEIAPELRSIRRLSALGPRRVGAGPKLRYRRAVPLPPQPVIVAQIGPEVSRRGGVARCVEGEMMRVLVFERKLARIAQPEEGLVEWVRCDASISWTRAAGCAAGAIAIDVVPERKCHEQVYGLEDEELRRDLRITLAAQVRSVCVS